MRILCIAAYRSNHADRHVELLARAGHEVHLAALDGADLERPPLDPRVRLHQRRAGTATPARPRVGPAAAGIGEDALLHLADRSLPGRRADAGASWIAAMVDGLRPDVVHSFSLHQASFLTLVARSRCRRPFPPWIVSNWGCDIHHFAGHPALRDMYRPAIAATLATADGYFAECRRDDLLAREHGFRGTTLAVAPIGGGFDLGWFRALRGADPPSRRRSIMVKGYQGGDSPTEIGLAATALEAVALAADALGDYEIVVYAAASAEVQRICAMLETDWGLTIRLPPFLPYDELMRLHGRARCSIAVSQSDGICTSALEAMLMGSVPIQSATSCLAEWTAPDSALLVPPHDPRTIATAIRRAVGDDAFADAAAAANDAILERRVADRVVDPTIIGMYEAIAQRPGSADSFEDRLGAAQRLNQEGLHASASVALEALLPERPESLALRYRLAEASLGMGDLAAARTRFGDALRRNPGFAWSHAGLGLVAERSGDAAEALEHFRRAVALQPDLASAERKVRELERQLAPEADAAGDDFADLFAAANAHADAGRPETAAQLYRILLQREPDSAALLCKAGATALKLRRVDDAAALLDRAVGCDPGFFWAQVVRADVLETQDLLEEALAALRTARGCAGALPLVEDRIAALHGRLGSGAGASAVVVADGAEDDQGRALLLIAALGLAVPRLGRTTLRFVRVRSPAVRTAIEALAHDVGAMVEIVAADAGPAAGLDGARLHIAVAATAVGRLADWIAEATRRGMGTLLALQLPDARSPASSIALGRAAHDPELLARHIVDRLAGAGAWSADAYVT